ncbi:MAG: hypothetical protein ABSE95_01540 [Thermodesulfobacteriota bacterium]|jgi:hypothetical protein
MKKQKIIKSRKRRRKKFLPLSVLGFFILLAGTAFSQDIDWTPPPWGLNLEELNKAFKDKNKTDLIREDKDRSEIELQYRPDKSIKFRRGKVTALLGSTDPSTHGRLYGYSFEGKFFGRAIFFKDHPEFFPETVNRILKEKYPQGKIIRTFGTTRSLSLFEYKSDQLYVFSSEKGVFYYDPYILEKVVKIEQGQIEKEEQKIEKEVKDNNLYRHY